MFCVFGGFFGSGKSTSQRYWHTVSMVMLHKGGIEKQIGISSPTNFLLYSFIKQVSLNIKQVQNRSVREVWVFRLNSSFPM